MREQGGYIWCLEGENLTRLACYACSGGSRISTSRATLPSKLVLKPVLPVKSAIHKLTIDTNKPPVSLNDIFPGKSVEPFHENFRLIFGV